MGLVNRRIWPNVKYAPGPENVVVDALSRLDTEKISPMLCYIGCRLSTSIREVDNLHLAENIFSSTHKENKIVIPLSAQNS